MVKVVIKLHGARNKLSTDAERRGRYAFANQAMGDMDQFVPMLSTALRGSSSTSPDGKEINYNTPYAKAQFYGKVGKGGHPVRNYSTPGTGPRWDLKAKGIFMSDWIDAFTKGADWN